MSLQTLSSRLTDAEASVDQKKRPEKSLLRSQAAAESVHPENADTVFHHHLCRPPPRSQRPRCSSCSGSSGAARQKQLSGRLPVAAAAAARRVCVSAAIKVHVHQLGHYSHSALRQ